jgi:uncharacterized protein (TIGR03437 family)
MIRLLILSSLVLVCLSVQSQSDSAAQTDTLVNVCAANYFRNTIAFDSIVAAFGSKLATATVVAGDADPQTPGIQLPTTLGGVSVRVAGKLAPLFFVSPGQINYLVPSGLRVEDLNDNFAIVEVVNGGNVVSSGRAPISRVAPAFFTFDSSGSGLPAALIVRVKPDDSQIIEPLGEFTAAPRGLQVRPVDVSPADERVFLVVYLSGVRNATDFDQDQNVNESVHVRLNDTEVEPYYVGAQRELAGLDQLNVQIPRNFYGQATLRLTVTWLETPGFEITTEVALATPPVGPLSWTMRGLADHSVSSFAVNETALLAGTSAGIFRSGDQGQTWIQAGNSTTNILTLYHEPDQPFFAGTAGNGVLISNDDGRNWGLDYLSQPDLWMIGRTVYALVDLGILYAGTDINLFRRFSGAQAKSWLPAPISNGPLLALTKNFNRAFAGTKESGVFTGQLNATGWTPSNQGLPAHAEVRVLATSAHYIFAALGSGGLYRSADNGVTWARVTNGMPSQAQFTALATHGRNIFAGSENNGVFVSTDYGVTWNAANDGLSNLQVRALLVHRGQIWLGTTKGIFATGNTLLRDTAPQARNLEINLTDNNPKAFSLAEDSLVGNQLSYTILSPPIFGELSGTPPHLTYIQKENFRGTDALTYTVSSGALVSTPARVEFIRASSNPPPVFYATGQMTVLAGQVVYLELIAQDAKGQAAKITSGNLLPGAVFSAGVGTTIPNKFYWTATAPGEYLVTFAATDNEPQPTSVTRTFKLTVRENLEKGRWTKLDLPPHPFPTLITDAAGVYVGLIGTNVQGQAQTRVLRSINEGNSWTDFSNGLPTLFAAQRFAVGNNYLYVGSPDGVWRTSTTTANWTAVNNGLSTQTRQVWDLDARGDTVVVSTSAGCYLSLNRGETWQPIVNCGRVAFTETALFVGSSYTLDNGATWQSISIPVTNVQRLQGVGDMLCALPERAAPRCTSDFGKTWRVFAPGVPFLFFGTPINTFIAQSGKTVFVGMNLYGVYVSRNAGSTWQSANLGLTQQSDITHLALHDDKLFATTSSGQIFVRKLANN